MAALKARSEEGRGCSCEAGWILHPGAPSRPKWNLLWFWGGGVVSTGSFEKQLKNVTLTTKIKKSEKIKQVNQNSLQPLA